MLLLGFFKSFYTTVAFMCFFPILPLTTSQYFLPLTPKCLKNLRTSAVTAMLEVNYNNTSSTSPSSPTGSSCPTATADSDQLKAPSIATSNSLFLEGVPGKSETLVSPSLFCSADVHALVRVLSLSEQKSRVFCAC